MSCELSSARSCMISSFVTLSLGGQNLRSQLGDPGPGRSVDHLIADAGDEAGQKRGVLLAFENDLLAGHHRQLLREAQLVRLREPLGRNDGGAGDARLLVGKTVELGGDGR